MGHLPLSHRTDKKVNWDSHDVTLDKVKHVLVDLERSKPGSLKILSSIDPYELRDMIEVSINISSL